VGLLTKSSTTVEATKLALDQIKSLTTGPFTNAEVDRAKDDLLSTFIFRYDTRYKMLNERALLEFYDYPANYLETYQTAIRNVSVADVSRVAKKYIHPYKLAILVVGNGAEINPRLADLDISPVQDMDITIPQPIHQVSGERKP